jgi:ribosomal protein S18 acetylase RimI-like enzyme
MPPAREDSGIRYALCDSADVDEMVRLLGAVFSQFDPPAVAVGLTESEFESFVRLYGARAAADGLTVVARAAETGEMVGALLTEDSASPPPEGLDRVSPKLDPIYDILGQLDADYRRGRALTPGEFLHLFLLGVAPGAGGRGVAQRLVAACLENGRARGYRVAVTEATGSASQHVFRKHGFQERVRRSYRDHRFEGRAPFSGIEGHFGPILMDRGLQET